MKILKTMFAYAAILSLAAQFANANSNQWQQLPNLPNVDPIINSITANINGNIYAVTGSQFVPGLVYKFGLGEKIWISVGAAIPDNMPVNVVAVDGNNNVFIGTGVGFDGHVYVNYANTNTWQQLGDNIGPISALTLGRDGTVYASVAAMNGSIQKIKPGVDQNWQPLVKSGVKSPDGPIYSILLDSENNFYIGTFNGTIFELDNKNSKWQQLASFNNASKKGTPVFALARRVSDGNLFAGSWLGHAFMMDNKTKEWSEIPVPDGERVNSMIVDASNNVYASTGSVTPGNIYKMKSGSEIWTQLTDQASPDGFPIYSLSLDSSNNMYVSSSRHIYHISQ